MLGLGETKKRVQSLTLVAALVTSIVVATAPGAGAAYECAQSFTATPDDAPNTGTGGDEENIDNLDIVAGGVNADDPTTLKVAVGVKNLDKTFPSNATSLNWYFQWTYADVDYFGRVSIAVTTPDTVTYSYGTFDATTNRYTVTAAAEGAFNAGPNGTVEIHVPYEGVGAPPAGDTLTQIHATTWIGQGVPGGPTTLAPIDRGPKAADSYGTDYVVGSCTGGGGGGGELASPNPTLGVSDKTPKRGSKVVATAGLKVCGDHAGTKIELQKKTGGKFKKVASKALGDTCKAKFNVTASFKSAVFRSYWTQQDEDHAAAASKPVTVKTH